MTEELLALEAMRLGEFDTAEKRLRTLAQREKVSPVVFNNLAWNAVARGMADKQALDDATTAVKRTSAEDAASLHTLAAVDAELGHTAEALENLRLSVQLRGDQTRDADWYVLGRIAQRYGLLDVAAGLYHKVPSAKRRADDDAYALAQRRLKNLPPSSTK